MNVEKLKELFERSNDKYSDSKQIGTTYQTMYNIIYKGSVCKVDLLWRIAKFYNVSVGYFFDEVLNDTLKNELLNDQQNYVLVIQSQQRTIESLSKTIESQQRMIELYSKKGIADTA